MHTQASRLDSNAAASTSAPEAPMMRPRASWKGCGMHQRASAGVTAAPSMCTQHHARTARAMKLYAAPRSSTTPTAATTAAPAPPGMRHLDMSYMEKVYKETLLQQADYNPSQRRSQRRTLRKLGGATSLQQVLNIVASELPAMTPPALTLAMLVTCFGPPARWAKHKQAGASSSSGHAAAAGADGDAAYEGGVPQAADSTGGSTDGSIGSSTAATPAWPADPASNPQARSLIRALLRQLAKCAAEPSGGGVDVGHVSTALLAVHRVLAPCNTRNRGSAADPESRAPGDSSSSSSRKRSGQLSSTEPHVNGVVHDLAVGPAAAVLAPGSDMPPASLNGAAAARVLHATPPQALAHAGAADAQDMADVSSLLAATQKGLFLARPATLAQYAQALTGISPLLRRFLPRNAAPFGSWASDFAKVFQSKLMLMDGRQMAHVSWALVCLGHVPSSLLVDSLTDAIQPHLSSLPPVQLVHALRALAMWRATPGDVWLSGALQAASAAAPSLQPALLCSLVGSLAALHAPGPDNWCPRLLQQLVEEAEGLGPAHHCKVLGVLVRLDARTFLNEQQLRQLLAAGTSCLPEASASQLVAQLWSLSCLRFLPPRAWMAQWSQCMRRQARGLSPTGLAAVLVAHARFGLRPPRELLQDLMELQLAQTRAATVSPADASCSLAALASLEAPPPRQLLRALLAALCCEDPPRTDLQWPRAGMSAAAPRGPAAGVAAALPDEVTRKQLRAAHARSLVVALTALPPQLAGYDQAALMAMSGAEAAPGVVLPGDDYDAHRAATTSEEGDGEESPAGDDGGAGSSRQPGSKPPAQTLTLAQVMAMLVPGSQLSGLLDVLQSHLEHMSRRQLYIVIRTLALLRLNPGRGFLSEHLSLMSRHLGRLGPKAKERLGSCYRRLQATPPLTGPPPPRPAVARPPASTPGGGAARSGSRGRTPVPGAQTRGAPGLRRGAGSAGY